MVSAPSPASLALAEDPSTQTMPVPVQTAAGSPQTLAAQERSPYLDGSGLLLQERKWFLSEKCQRGSDSVLTGIAVSIDISVTQLLGMY